MSFGQMPPTHKSTEVQFLQVEIEDTLALHAPRVQVTMPLDAAQNLITEALTAYRLLTVALQQLGTVKEHPELDELHNRLRQKLKTAGVWAALHAPVDPDED